MTTTLQEAVLALAKEGEPLFAVLDGAQFDNLPEDLMFGDFVSRSLYLDRGENDAEQVITAPHMVWLDETGKRKNGRTPVETIPALLTLIGDRPAAVFWQCPAGADILYKHLRSINMVLYPKSELEDWEEPEPPEGQEAQTPDTHTLVLFRHADANVMAQVLPALENASMARLFGPASALAGAPSPDFATSPEHVIHRPPHLPRPAIGHLRLSVDVIHRMNEAEMEASRAKIRDYLKEVAPEYTDTMPETDLRDVIIKSEIVGEQIGLESEAAFGTWTFLALITGQETLKNPHILQHFKDDPRHSDDQVEELMDQIANATDKDFEAWS